MEIGRLQTYLREHLPDYQGLEVKNIEDISDGWETEIHAFDIEYRDKKENRTEELILRMYPGPPGSERARVENLVYETLTKLGYPVPKVYLVEESPRPLGLPFLIMERINGRPMMQMISESDSKSQEMLDIFSRLFVTLHGLEWQTAIDNPETYMAADPYFYIKRYVQWYGKFLKEHDTEQLLPIVDWLNDRLQNSPCESPSLMHGDFHPNNILIDEGGNPFVIDWTASNIADSRFDLGWTLLLARTYLGKEMRATILQGYEKHLQKRVKQVEFFEVTAILRRLTDILVSLREGSTELGMREGAMDLMRESFAHIRAVHSVFTEYTSIEIPMVEETISSFESKL